MRRSKKYDKMSPIWPIFLLLVFLAASIGAAQEFSDDDDPVLDYYVEQADHAFESRHPQTQGISYSYRATTRYRAVDANGTPTTVDSGIVDYWYSFGELDSSRVVKPAERAETVLSWEIPNVFDSSYQYYFFPNDPGQGDLAIGFETPDAEDPRPIGFANIDRNYFWLTGLHLSYANIPNYKRLTKSYSFTQVQGVFFPDTVVEQGAKLGFFQTENYRIETVLSDITVDL